MINILRRNEVDYNRHLEEIANKTERILLSVVQKCIATCTKAQQPFDLMTKWESFKNTQPEDANSRTMSDEAKLFTAKLVKLKEVLTHLRSLKSESADGSLKALDERLDKLRMDVEEEKSLNAGGKFEWVDSLLIKCLQDGCWLLIENVNLCSPAVLDRLNGLLEPNGILTVGERGVDENGEMINIVPHKNFRLFLTMDPKNGEISRAMRNRGLEIYLLNDLESGYRNIYDIKSLIEQNGISSEYLQEILIQAHDYISELVLGEKPTVSYILQASFLIHQQLLRGISIRDAFKASLVDVYVRSKSWNDFKTSNPIASIEEYLEALFQRYLDRDTLDTFSVDNTTLRSMDLQNDSHFELVKQQSVLVTKLELNNSLEKLASYLFFGSYSISSCDNVTLKCKYLSRQLKKGIYNELNNKLFTCLSKLCEKSNEKRTMPVDKRWLADTYDGINIHVANQTLLLLYVAACTSLRGNLLIAVPKSKNLIKLTVLEYSKALSENLISQFFIEHPLVKHFYKLLQVFDEFLQRALETRNLQLSTEQLVHAFTLLNWRFVLQEIGSLPIYDKNEKDLNLSQVLSQVIVRYKWFYKRTINYFIKFADTDNSSDELTKLITLINADLQDNFSNFSKISRRFIKSNHRPLPPTDKKQITFATALQHLEEKTSLISRNNSHFRTRCDLLLTHPEIRIQLIDSKQKFITDRMYACEQINDVDISINSFTSHDPNLLQVELLPIKDALALRFITKLKKDILLSSKIEKGLILRKTLSVPSELIAVTEAFLETTDEKLLPELILLLAVYCRSSIALSPTRCLDWEHMDDDDFQLKQLAIHVPVLSYLITNICISNKRQVHEFVSLTSLGKYKEKSEQLRCLNEIIWINISSLSSVQFDNIKNDSTYISYSFEKFITVLEKSLTGNNSAQTLKNKINNCILEINRIYQLNVETKELTKSKEKLISLIERCYQHVESLQASENIDLIIHTANVYSLLNYLKAYLSSQLPVIDPLEKVALKKKYCEEEKIICTDMRESFLMQNEVYSGNKNTLHPVCAVLAERIHVYEQMENEFSKHIAARPEYITYEDLVKDASHNINTLLSDEFFTTMFEKLNACIKDIQDAIHNKEPINLKDCKDVLKQASSWLNSQENSYAKLKKYRVGYCDLVEPILSSTTELSYGVKLLQSVLEKLLVKYEYMHQKLDQFVLNLIQFPTLGDSQKSVTSLVEICSHSKNTDLIAKILDDLEIPSIIKQENLSMLKCGLQEIYNLFVVSSPSYLEPSNNMLVYLENLINLFVSAWCTQETERKQKDEEESSIYKTKTKCDDLSEEEEMFIEMRKLFPSYHEQDFSDIRPPTLDDTPEEKTIPDEQEIVGVITNDDITFVSSIHSELLQTYTKSEWLNPVKKNLDPEFVQPLLQRFKLYNLMQDKIISGLDSELDKNLLGSLNLLVAITKYFGEGNNVLTKNNSNFRRLKEKNYDFYKDAKVDEVKLCYPVLESLRKRVLELQKEWPEHPTLKNICTVTDRIYSFSITSPISRFLTGLEILLSKCHEWEENAHTGVSLQDYTQHLTLQIISWRKLELAGWKDSLNITAERIKKSASKWWFHMYSTVQQFIIINKTEEENYISAEKFVRALQQFIEKSTLGEFRTRLDLLFVFHCHLLNIPKTKRTEQVVSILWNLYNFYNQFTSNVDGKIKNLRTPIEKKLKDFVKIARWNDINYWAVKETVEKTHRTLHKYIKEFENVLKQAVTDCLINVTSEVSESEQVGIWDRQLRHSPSQYHYTLDSSSYLASAKFKKILNENSPTKSATSADSLIHNSEKYFNKSRDLCKNTISNVPYPSLLKHLDSFVTDIIETSNHLRNLEVNADLPKEKQKSQAKNILQQKRKALADLFKALTKCGLSYRTGIIEAKLRENTTPEFLLKPLDLEASFSHLKQKGSCDRLLLNVWDGCETYFLRTVARLAALNTCLNQPHTDLGLQNIERCKGFSMHLMVLGEQQKKQLIESSRHLYYLRHFITQLSDIHEEAEIIKSDKIQSLYSLLVNIVLVMEQFKILLLSCPEQPNFTSDLSECPLLDTENQNLIKYKNDEHWSVANTEIKNIIHSTNKLKSIVDKIENKLQSAEIRMESPNHLFIQNINSIINDLQVIEEKISSLRNTVGDNVLSNSLVWLLNELTEVKRKFEQTDDEDEDTTSDIVTFNKFKMQVEKFMESILLPIQNIYKKYNVSTEETEEPTNPEGETEIEEFKDNHLKSLIVENLLQDITTLDMKTVFRKLKKIVVNLHKVNSNDSKRCRSLICQCIPILEQLILLYQYFITQQVSAYRVTCKLSSVLLNVFIELASKGFCIPEEFSKELSKEGESTGTGGMGLGDGEGEKDVSERIESEDQLEDAQPAGQEKKKDEDKDCKEEEKGVEMSEDFEGKLQDVDKPENEDSSQSDDDSDAEKQMGETETGCDQLDQQIWGSDDEDENDDDKDGEQDTQKDKEEKGDGGEVEDKQMAAKEDDAKPNEDDDDKQQDNTKEKKQKQDDINEMNEPEYDDEQVDPYHGKQPEIPEPEPMDLPDDLQLDEGEEKGEQAEENPFDIDAMKEQMPPESETKDDAEDKDEQKGETEEKQDDVDSSDEEEQENTKPSDEMQVDKEPQENTEENKEQPEGGMQEKQENEETEQTENNNTSALDNQQSTEDEIQPMEVENVESADNVETTPNQASAQNAQESTQEENKDKDGVGQLQIEDSETGHRGEVNATKDSLKSQKEMEKQVEKRQRPGESDSKRSLGETSEPVKKKMKTINIQDKNIEEEDKEEEGAEEGKDADVYQHIKEAKEHDTQVMDAATREQAETQKIENKEDDKKEEDSEEPIEMATDEPELEVVETKEQASEQTESKSKQKKDAQQGEITDEMQEMDVEGDVVETTTVRRGDETTYHTQYEDFNKHQVERLTAAEIQGLRMEIESQLGKWNEPPPNAEAEQTWENFSAITSSLARDLSEQLRLVLEPTQASRLRGDFRTGRRINMRKVIPYIASQFRKDKIWLRRTKPSKRDYQIVLAIDDSSSMDDNHSKELAFESVALISKALTLLESGQLSVVSFGENTEILHKLTDTFTEKSGVKLLQKFQFQQKKTCVANLVDFVTNMLSDTSTTAMNAKLLIIVSDGRGIFSEGESIVRQAIRRAKFANIFMVFVIVENPENKNSILDIRMPMFSEGKLLGIKSYIDNFPFPFYIILRNINTLPSVLSDALRQWFELVTNVDK